MSRALITRVVAAAAIAMCLQSPAAQAQERDLKFVLDFISLGRHAPWYVALGKGYFKDEGLNVTIMPSKGTADAIRTVATGVAEIGFIDIPSLVASGSGGAGIKIVSVNYQKPPYCIFTLDPGANVTKPQQMAGLELGSSTASFVARSKRPVIFTVMPTAASCRCRASTSVPREPTRSTRPALTLATAFSSASHVAPFATPV